jgi:regulator of sigma E protease
LFAGQPVSESLSGPVGIAVMTGQMAKMGFAYLLNFTALLSLNLAILNLLPFPALDGGRLLFLAIGRLMRRRVPLKFEQIAHTLGFFLLMVLVVLITVKDIGRFSGALQAFLGKIF